MLSFIYHDVFDGRGFSRVSASWPRYRVARALFRELGLLRDDADRTPGLGPAFLELAPDEATDEDILSVHAPELLARVKEGDRRGEGLLDYGDTPAWPGVLRRARLAVGGTLLAAQLVASGDTPRAFNPAGGLHHANGDRAGGFCPFNDVVIAIRFLQRRYGLTRIAVVDLDGHHGDGTETLLYAEPILTISMHRYGGRFYPRTGAPGDVGVGAGFGYNLNVPLERGTGDAAYLTEFDRWVAPALRRYLPTLIFVVVGADSHRADPLVHLGLTLRGYAELARRLSDLSDELCGGRIVAVAGGGYSPPHVAHVWAISLGTLARAWEPNDPRVETLYRADTEG